MSVHGTARFADRDDVGNNLLFYGTKPGVLPTKLLVGWWYENSYDFQPIEYDGDLHQLIVAGTGGGKFTSAIAPMLLGSLHDKTVVCIDPKGEIANLFGPYCQRAFDDIKRVHLLDPWDLCGTGSTEALNVLEEITLDNPNYVDDARALADAMIIPSGEKNTHWDNTAKNFLTAMLLYVALHPKEEGRRDLLRLRDLVTMTWAQPKAYVGKKRETLSELLAELSLSDLAGGALRRGATAILNREDKERSGILSSIDRETAWMDSPQMEKVLRGASIDMKIAGLARHKYFVVLPPDYFRTHRAWLRLCITAFAKAFKRHRPHHSQLQHERWRHIIIDEFQNLGEMPFVQDDISVARGYDVKYHLVVQDLSKLRQVYQDGWESFINNTFQRFFAVSDMFTCDYVSRMLGAATVNNYSSSTGKTGGVSFSSSMSDTLSRSSNSGAQGMPGGTSSGYSRGYSESVSENNGWSHSETVSQVQRPLRTPDEVRRLEDDRQYIFFRGMPPIESWRPGYWRIFPSLPTYSLAEVFGTIGRAPKNEKERLYFNAWRDVPLIASPEPTPPELLPPPQKRLTEQPPRFWENPLVGPALCGALLLLVLWIGWSYVAVPFYTWLTTPAPKQLPAQRFTVAPAPVPQPTPPPQPATPVIAPTVAPVVAPPNPFPTRDAVPNNDAAGKMPAGAATRDYFLKLMMANKNKCWHPNADQEAKLMQHLARWAIAKREDVSISLPGRHEARGRYAKLFNEYKSKRVLSRGERDALFNLVLNSIRENFYMTAAVSEALDQIYSSPLCPFGTVDQWDYVGPNYSGALGKAR